MWYVTLWGKVIKTYRTNVWSSPSLARASVRQALHHNLNFKKEIPDYWQMSLAAREEACERLVEKYLAMIEYHKLSPTPPTDASPEPPQPRVGDP